MVAIVFVHPDLGIGGAERLVVDAAVALKNQKHSVHIVTTHHSQTHCFTETVNGTLPVTVVGDWLPRTILGRCYAICAYIRMMYAALYLTIFSNIKTDIVFCDQVSACIPVFRIFAKPVIFYCHFPDQLLCQPGNAVKRLYRVPLNWLEEVTTGLADTILVNSHFTKTVFMDTFKSITIEPRILYPSINVAGFDTITVDECNKDIFLSINRYERKKNISLAIQSLSDLKSKVSDDDWNSIKLVIAGGYDPLVPENMEYYNELNNLAKELEVSDKIEFMKSPSDVEKVTLIKQCCCVIYTPLFEHFGIVPLEAMYCKKPVIAVNSGGPKETIRHEETGYLCDANPDSFSNAMYKCYKDKKLTNELGVKARSHFDQLFSFYTFSQKLDRIVLDTLRTEVSNY